MMNETKHVNELALIGGRLCLDFVNTVNWRTGKRANDFLTTYQALVEWSQHTGLLTGDEARNLLQEADKNPDEAEEILKQAVVLREAMYRIMQELMQQRQPHAADLTLLSDAHAVAQCRLHLVAKDEGLVLDWRGQKRPDFPLWPVVRSAVSLLLTPEVKHIRQCEGDNCGWLFVDMSRNKSRRWCNSQDCGNRLRVRQYYRRRRAQGIVTTLDTD